MGMGEGLPPERDQPIWQQPGLLPAKPQGAPYGVVARSGEAVPAYSRGEFVEIASKPDCRLDAAWTPDSSELLLPEEVPELAETVYRRKKEQNSEQYVERRQAVLMFGGLLLAYTLLQLFRGLRPWNDFLWPMAAIMWFAYAVVPFYEVWKRRKWLRTHDPSAILRDAHEWRFEYWLRREAAPVTKLLLGSLVGVYLVALFAFYGREHLMLAAGALVKEEPYRSELWRLLTCSFLHSTTPPMGALHIIMNGLALVYLGRRVEVLAGWPHLLNVYLVSVLLGGVASLTFTPAPSVGASGGLMGLLGFLLVFETLHQRLVPISARRRLLAGLILVYIVGLIGIQFIDNAAHTGGLLAGFTYALIVFPKSTSPRRPQANWVDKASGLVAGTVLLWTAIYLIFRMKDIAAIT